MVDLNSLDDCQRKAVLCIDRPSLVIAGAGSGKTRVLTYKIAYLIDSGYTPESILALTFTKKAANEMKSRIADIIGTRMASRVWMGTFHSIFMKILLFEHDLIGYPANFTIYDNTDSKNIVKSIIRELKLDEKVYKPAEVYYRISNAKNNLISPSAYMSSSDLLKDDAENNLAMLGTIYKTYWDRCRQSGVMDFDDLLVYTFLLFDKYPDVCKKYSERFRFVLVDEYQDTNFAQHRIMMQLAKNNEHICVVGDDAQSIYSFRGAKIDNILNFTKYFKNAALFKLEANYRSTQNIVSAANSLIEKNRRQIRKSTYSTGGEGSRIQVFKAYSDIEEASIVVNRIKGLIRHGIPAGDIAILYRTNSQSRMFEEELRKQAVPYKIFGGLSFYQRKEIKDVIAYFRLICNRNDEEAFKRIINYPKRGIGNSTVDKIVSKAIQSGVSLWEVASSPLEYNLEISSGIASKLKNFCSLINGFLDSVQNGLNAYELARQVVLDSGIKREFDSSTDPEDASKKENINELMNGISNYCHDYNEEYGRLPSLYDYITDISLISDIEDDESSTMQKVNLMTVHMAKGLEFSEVFIVGLEEKLFPYIMNNTESYNMIEEERRLCYVAITRAKNNCYLSYAKSRYRFGQIEYCKPSRFITDIDPKYLCLAGPASSTGIASKVERVQKILKPVIKTDSGTKKTYSKDFHVGVNDRIRHERFGIGTIIKIEGEGDNTKASVEFDNVGTKQLLLKYAKFEILDK